MVGAGRNHSLLVPIIGGILYLGTLAFIIIYSLVDLLGGAR